MTRISKIEESMSTKISVVEESISNKISEVNETVTTIKDLIANMKEQLKCKVKPSS